LTAGCVTLGLPCLLAFLRRPCIHYPLSSCPEHHHTEREPAFYFRFPIQQMAFIIPQPIRRLNQIQDSLFSHSDCCGVRMVSTGNDMFVCTNCRQPCSDDPRDR
jgi:hypothetical protein